MNPDPLFTNRPTELLTPREWETIERVADGYTTEEIAIELSVAAATIKNRIHLMMYRYGAKNRAHLIAILVRKCRGE